MATGSAILHLKLTSETLLQKTVDYLMFDQSEHTKHSITLEQTPISTREHCSRYEIDPSITGVTLITSVHIGYGVIAKNDLHVIML